MHDISIVPPGRNADRVACIPTDESVGYCQIVPDGTDTSNDVTPSLAACAMMRSNSCLSIIIIPYKVLLSGSWMLSF